VLLAGCITLAGCPAAHSAPPALQFLGQQQVPSGSMLDGTVIGGLSGLSYDADRDIYYIVSDDRSQRNPARFYTARIRLSPNGVESVEFLSTHPWRSQDGQPFGPLDVTTRPATVPPDAEGIAVDTRRQRLYWTSEGERLTDDPASPVLQNPWVRTADLTGGYLGAFRLPPTLDMAAGERGPRRNKGLEGLTLTPSGRWLWAAMEGPLHEDGDPPSDRSGALVRITRLDPETNSPAGQYAYPVDPVTAGPGGDNGVSDLVALDDSTFLVVERGYADRNSVRIYRAEIGDAEDISTRPALKDQGVRAMTKTLLADLTDKKTVDPLDNIEGITLGPILPDGRRSVLLFSDDNFSPRQVMQVLAFALS
jgi:hypothetical protein